MSTKNVGGISWVVDADTTGAVSSMGAVNATIDKTETKFKKLDTQTTKTAKGVNKAVAGMGRKAGQAGIQFQQFIGQIQGGQNAMVALSAQSADLGFVLGAPLLGAVAGITASLLGMLVPALFASGESAEELTDKIKELVKASTLTKAQSKFMVDQANDEIKANKKLIEETSRKLKQNEAIINNYDLLAKKKKEGGNLTNEEITTMKMMGSIVKTARKDNIQYAASIDTLNEDQKKLTKQKKAYSNATMKSESEQKAETKALETYNAVIKSLEQTLAVASREALGMTAEAKELNAEFQAEKILGGKATEEQIKTVVALLGDVATAQDEAAGRKKGVAFAERTLTTNASPIDKLKEEQEQLLALKAMYVDQSALFDEALTANSKKQADLRASYQIANANIILSSSASIFGNIASMLKSSGDDQSTAYKAMFAVSKAFSIAQAGLNLALAISNASAVTPWYSSLAAIAEVTAAGAGVVGAVSSATYSGREDGGSVLSGQTYEVGEKNKPELLMIPGNNGKVLSNSEMKGMAGGNGAQLNQTINNYGGADGYQVQSRGDGITSPQVIDIVRSEMGNANSYSRRALATTSNVSNVTRGRR